MNPFDPQDMNYERFEITILCPAGDREAQLELNDANAAVAAVEHNLFMANISPEQLADDMANNQPNALHRGAPGVTDRELRDRVIAAVYPHARNPNMRELIAVLLDRYRLMPSADLNRMTYSDVANALRAFDM